MENEDMPEWCAPEDWCPITVTAELLGRKWHPVIIHRLLQHEMNFSKLKKEVKDVSDKVLCESLTDLREKDIVEKNVVSESPKEVKYRLTEKGESLEHIIMSMKEWGEENYEPEE